MTANEQQAVTPPPRVRWYQPTPGRLLVALLALEGLLLLSERCLPMGWAVLLAVASVVLTMVLMLLWFVASLAFRWQFRFSVWWLLLLTIAVAIPFSWLSQRFQWFAFDEKRDWAVFPSIASVVLTMVGMLLWFVLVLTLRFRWQFQFSIRTLLALVVIIAIPCSWMATETKRAKEQKEAVEAIQKLGGEVLYDCHYDWSAGQPFLPGPVWLRELLGTDFFLSVATVGFQGTQATEGDLVNLQQLPQLQNVLLGDIPVTDAGLAHLKGLTQLLMLSLNSTQITDGGLEHLKGMTRLVFLSLVNTHITDAGLKHLQALPQLQALCLNNTQITDAGLVYLRGLQQLKSLNLTGTSVADAGVKKLQQALPNCQIVWR